jgi:hypothetical protein
MIRKGEMSYRSLDNLAYEHSTIVVAAHYLPEWLQNSPAVWGALALIHRAHRMRLIDLNSEAISWSSKFGEPEINKSVGELERDYPFLTRVAFESGINLAKPELYEQFFGQTPGLRKFATPDDEELFGKACEKWPLEDTFGFCPLPVWKADHSGETLWFEEYNWPEQKNELLRLQRRYPGVTVRFATMPELMFLDLSMRLITGGESPVGIESFRCEYPDDPSKCLKYGGVGDYGAVAEVDKNPDKEHYPVLPLFILKRQK